MSGAEPEPSGRFPRTTARAIALAAAVGVLALAAFEPVAVVGAGLGAVLAVVISAFDGSTRRVAVAAALFPLPLLGAVAVVGTAGAPIASAAVLCATVVAAAAGIPCTGSRADLALERARTAALYASGAAGCAAVVAVAIPRLAGPGSALWPLLRFGGDGPRGLLVGIAVATFAVAGGIVALPPAAVVPPSRRESYVYARNGLIALVAVGAVVGSIAILVLLFLAWLVGPLEPAVAAIVDSGLVRGLCALATVGGVVVAASGLVVRFAWHGASDRENATVPILAGSTVGVVGAFPVAAAVGGPTDVGALFGVAAVACFAGWLLGLGHANRAGTAAVGPIVVAVGLAIGGVAVGASVDTVLDAAGIRASAAALVAIAAALFAYDTGRYGRALARDVGRAGVTRRPQLARAGWSALVAGVGLPVAAVGLVVATLFAPTLSVPATAGVLAALCSVLAGTWLLFR